MQIGEIIKKYRLSTGVLQGEFSRILDVTQNYLSMIELGKKKPSHDVVERFSSISGISVEAISVISSDMPVELSDNMKNSFISLQEALKKIHSLND